MDRKTKLYFERSVKYSKGDVEALLRSELPCAGPLLVTTLNGIDNLVGMCYGFGCRVGDRSKKFLREEMGLPEHLAAFLYESVRCGIVHQGMPKMGIELFVQYKGSYGGELFHPQSDNEYISLDVTELARLYLKTIEKIAKEPERHINYHPQYSDTKKNELKNLFRDAKNDIVSATRIYTHRQYDVEEAARVDAGQSSTAYTGEMHYIDLPPYDDP